MAAQTEITTIVLNGAERLEQNKLDSVGIMCEIAQDLIEAGATKGQWTKAAQAVKGRLDLSMTPASLAARIGEAVPVVAACDGKAANVDAALERFNADRLANNRKAVSSLQNVDFRASVGIVKAERKAETTKKVKTLDQRAAEAVADMGADKARAFALAILAAAGSNVTPIKKAA